MRKQNRTVLTNIAALFSIRGMEYLVGLLVFPYLVRTLGMERYGAIVFAQSFSQYFILVTNYAFNLTAPRDIAAQPDEQERGRIFVSVLGAKLVLLAVCSAAFFLLLANVALFSADVGLYLCVYLCIVGDVVFPVWYFQGIERMKYITYVNMAARLLTMAAIFACVNSREDAVTAAFLQSVTPILAGLFSFGILWRRQRQLFVRPDIAGICQQLIDGWRLFLSTIAINLYTGSNVFFLGLATDSTMVGYFSGAQKIVLVAHRAVDTISAAIYPRTSSLAARSQVEAARFIRGWGIKFGVLGAGLTAVLFVFARQIAAVILGDGAGLSGEVLRVLSWIPFIVAFTNIFAIQTLIPFGRQQLFSRIVLWSAMLNLVIIFPLIYGYAALGVAFAMVTTEVFVAALSWYFVRRQGLHDCAGRS